MATTGRKQVAPGQLIQSSAWGNPLWDQSVQCFTSAADCDNQYPAASRHQGSVVWFDDVKQLLVWVGAAWRNASGDVTVTGTTLAGVVFNPTVHRPHTYLFHTSVTTNQYGQVNVPVANAGFLGYIAAHGQPNNRAWFSTIDFGNAPSLAAILLIMKDTAGASAVNQSVDLSVTVHGWK